MDRSLLSAAYTAGRPMDDDLLRYLAREVAKHEQAPLRVLSERTNLPDDVVAEHGLDHSATYLARRAANDELTAEQITTLIDRAGKRVTVLEPLLARTDLQPLLTEQHLAAVARVNHPRLNCRLLTRHAPSADLRREIASNLVVQRREASPHGDPNPRTIASALRTGAADQIPFVDDLTLADATDLLVTGDEPVQDAWLARRLQLLADAETLADRPARDLVDKVIGHLQRGVADPALRSRVAGLRALDEILGQRPDGQGPGTRPVVTCRVLLELAELAGPERPLQQAVVAHPDTTLALRAVEVLGHQLRHSEVMDHLRAGLLRHPQTDDDVVRALHRSCATAFTAEEIISLHDDGLTGRAELALRECSTPSVAVGLLRTDGAAQELYEQAIDKVVAGTRPISPQYRGAYLHVALRRCVAERLRVHEFRLACRRNHALASDYLGYLWQRLDGDTQAFDTALALEPGFDGTLGELLDTVRRLG